MLAARAQGQYLRMGGWVVVALRQVAGGGNDLPRRRMHQNGAYGHFARLGRIGRDMHRLHHVFVFALHSIKVAE